MGFGRAGLYFWDELPGRLPLLSKRFRAMGGPDCKKVSPCHLYATANPYIIIKEAINKTQFVDANRQGYRKGKEEQDLKRTL